jgi:hypothetical protein
LHLSKKADHRWRASSALERRARAETPWLTKSEDYYS